MADELHWWDARRVAAAVRTGELHALDVVLAHHHRIAHVQPSTHAWLARAEHEAIAHAERIDAARTSGATLGALCGVPLGLKDLFVTAGLETTGGSRVLAGWIPPYQGTHAARLAAADAVLLGKLAMDELAMGSSNENGPNPPVHNPWAPDRVAGGSSGGAAAAVASGTTTIALGTDTGGSIRQPASLCGIVGLKPSWGRVTRSGMIAFASSLDQAGPMTRNVRDAAAVLEVIAGADAGDATCVTTPTEPWVAACDRGAIGLRVGVHRRALELPGQDDDVRAAFEHGLAVLRDRGAVLVDIELPHFELAIATYYVLCTAEAASNLARYDGVRYGPRASADSLVAGYEATRSAGFGAEVKRRILLGTFVLRKDSYAAYYGRAQRVRTLIARDYEQAFASCDVIASPTSPVPAFAHGERTADPLAMYLADVFTVGANLAGLPAISIPCGFTKTSPRLPIGLQLIGPRLREDIVLAAAAAHEDGTTWHRERPPEPAAQRAETTPGDGAIP